MEELLEKVLSYKESGISLLERDKDEEIWQYGQGILFTVTVVTTIGKSRLLERVQDEANGLWYYSICCLRDMK